MEAKLTELLQKGIKYPDVDKANVTKCHLRQTMAWDECGRQVNCPSSCTQHDDCTFPYCDLLGVCECRNGKTGYSFNNTFSCFTSVWKSFIYNSAVMKVMKENGITVFFMVHG